MIQTKHIHLTFKNFSPPRSGKFKGTFPIPLKIYVFKGKGNKLRMFSFHALNRERHVFHKGGQIPFVLHLWLISIHTLHSSIISW